MGHTLRGHWLCGSFAGAAHTATQHFSAAPHRTLGRDFPLTGRPAAVASQECASHLSEQWPSRLTGSGRAARPVGHRPLIPAGPPSAHLPQSRAGAASTPEQYPPPLTSDSTITGEPGAGDGVDARVTSKPRSCEAWPHGDSRCQRRPVPWVLAHTARRGPVCPVP